MAGFVFVQGGGFSPASGGAVVQDLGDWDAAANSPALADADGYVNGAYFTCTTEANVDLGSGSQFFTVGDKVQKDLAGIWIKDEEAPMLQQQVLTADGRIITTAGGAPVWAGS